MFFHRFWWTKMGWCAKICGSKNREVMQMPFKFHGGVHPNYMKAPDVPVTVIAPPPQVVLPVMQHIGAPCKPLVEVGDYVKMGQKIADNPAPVSAPIHATVSGKPAERR